MGFRRSKEEAGEAREWQEFRADQQELFTKAGLPGFMNDRSRFDDFLMHSISELPGGLADGVAFDVKELGPEQREALGQLVALYLDRFDDPGIGPPITLWMPRPQINADLANALAEAVRRYLHAPPGDTSMEEESFPDLSSAVARLVGSLLAGEDGWSRYWWVDSFYRDPAYGDSVSMISPLGLDIRGVLIWGDEQNQWIDPFQGSIQLSAERDRIDSYEFRFGDAGTGLGQVEYGDRRPTAWRRTRNWLYVFRSG